MQRVVITHVGLIAPNGKDFETFGRNLREGISGLGEIDCFDAQRFQCRIVGQVRDLDRQALQNGFPMLEQVDDRKIFLGLTAFLQLLEGGAANLTDCPIHLGTSLECYLLEKLFRLSPHRFDLAGYLEKIPGNTLPYLQPPLDYLGNLIKSRFHIRGAHYLNCSACTAGTQAIGHGFQLIREGRHPKVIAGGFDSMLNPLGLGGFSRLGALSADNSLGAKAIRPFDVTRSGTVLGEGAAVFILESLDEALGNHSPILAEITGYASSFDAYKLSEPDPEGSGLAAAMERALQDAGTSPEEVDYISAHGTGTLSNDRVETRAIKRVFGARAHRIPVSSMKSMIGHLIGASGAVEIAGILAMLRDDFIAPTLHLEKPDPLCDLDYVPREARNGRIRIALKNSMGFGGQNAVLVLKRYD